MRRSQMEWQLQNGRQKILFIKFKYSWEFVRHKFETAPTIASIQIFINVKQGVKQRVVHPSTQKRRI